MKKLKMFLKSFYKNVIVKRKFKAFLHLLFDKEYRGQINRLHELCKDKLYTKEQEIQLSELIPGHKIIYPGYVSYLLMHESTKFIESGLKVVKDGNSYVVVDGNHRLAAIQRYQFDKNWKIKCIVVL